MSADRTPLPRAGEGQTERSEVRVRARETPELRPLTGPHPAFALRTLSLSRKRERGG